MKEIDLRNIDFARFLMTVGLKGKTKSVICAFILNALLLYTYLCSWVGQSPIFHHYKSLDPCLQGCIDDHTEIELFFRDHSHYQCEHRVLFQQGVNRRLQCETTIVYLTVRTVYAYKSPHSILNVPRNCRLISNYYG